MKTYTPTKFRQESYKIINQVANGKVPVRITISQKNHLNNKNTYLVNEKTLEQARKYKEIEKMQKGLDYIAKHSQTMNEREFKHEIGL